MSTTLSSPEPLAVGEQNPFDLLADESTVDAQLNRSNDLDESKQDDSSSRRFGKDDMKEQAYQARTQIKAKATDLKEQVVQSDTVQRGSQTIQQGVDSIKQKSSDIQQSIPSKQDLKDKAADLQSSIPSAQDLKDKAVDLQQSIPNAQQLKSKVVDLKDDLMQSESVKLASHKIQEGIDTIKEKAGLKEDQEEEQTSSPIEKDSSIKAKSAKGKAADLKAQASDAINQGVDMAKSKAADLKQSIPSTADGKVMMQQGIDAVKEKAADIQQSIPSKDELKGKAADLKQSASKKAADVKDQAIDSETIASAKAKYQQSVDAAKEKITDAQKAAPSKKDQAADSNVVQRGSKVVQDGIDTAKAKATDLKQSIPSTQDIKSKAADLQSQIPSTQDLKGKASDLKDQVMNSEIVAQASQKVQQGIDAVKGKANDAGSKKSTPKGKTKSLKAQASDAIDQGVAKANDLKDQIVNSDAMASASATIQQGIDTVKAKAADIQQSLPSKQDVKEKAANLQSQIPSKDEVKGKAQQLKQDASSKVSQATNSSVHSNPNEHVKVFPSKRLSAHTKAEIQSKAGDLKAQGQQAVKQGLDAAKEQVGLEKDATNEELVDEVQSQASEKMTEIKQRGAKVLSQAASKINQTLDANLSDEQKAKIDSGIQQAKQATAQAAAQGKYWIDYVLRGPLLRPVGTFIRRHNLQLPATIFLSFAGLWLGLTLIRLVTTQTHPHKPEIDIHSKEATMDWLRYHSGDLKGKAIDMRESLSGRAASFLANHEYDAMKSKAIDWKEIGMHKLGLTEPTWGEWAWAKLTGRPITWEDRVDSILNLAKKGVADRAADLSKYSAASLIGNMKDSVKSAASNLQNKAVPEPTLQERAAAMLHNMRTSLSTAQPELSTVDSIKSSLRDSVDSIRSRLPGSVGGLSAEEMKQRAYDATHQSTLGSIKSGAEYVKNRILHGSQEAAHVAQDRANELADKAKYKAGL